ncbi:MAG: 1-deoxy-D-xylulose-5-phosphate synthase N-terminal domain-containing protein [Alphaproteobacteria bacterium]
MIDDPAPENWPAEARRLAAGIRRRTLDIAISQNGAYLGQACSSAEILATLHCRTLNPANGDVFVLSPAHYSLALFALMVELGTLPEAALASYNQDGSALEMIGGRGAPGMVFTTGSLAQGLSQAIGLALAKRHKGEPGRVVVYLSDGELQEGQTWEAFMTLAHYRLSSVLVVLDLNDSQVDGAPAGIMTIEPIRAKLAAFGLDAVEIDGHDCRAIDEALSRPIADAPRAVLCRTRIWQGFPSLKSRTNLHYVRFRPGEAELARADLATHERAAAP